MRVGYFCQKFIRPYLSAGLMLLTAILFFLPPTPAAEVGMIGRKDIIHLKNGKDIEGSILLSGPRGTSIITMKGGRLEQFFAAADIKSIEYDIAPATGKDKTAVKEEEKVVSHYQAEPLAGKLEVVDIGAGKPSGSNANAEEWGKVEKEKPKPEKKGNKDKKSKAKKSFKRGLTPIFRPKPILGRDKEKDKKGGDAKAGNENLFGQNDKK